MKKVLVLFGIFSIAQLATFAAMEVSEISNIDSLRKQGFSESTLKAVDVSYSQTSGNEEYVRYYTPKSKNKTGKAYSYLKQYFDPIQNDDRFGEHQIEFANTWLGDETSYTTGNTKNEEVIEDL